MSVKYEENRSSYGYDFITDLQIPKGKNEYYLRDGQNSGKKWQPLSAAQIKTLERNGNEGNWQDVLVTADFNPEAVKNSSFYGLVRLGALGNGFLRHHDFAVPEGISESRIISCDIGDHCAIHNCAYMSHYIIGNKVILSNVGELAATNHCKAGNGIVKDGEDESVRIWLDPLNEAGGRSILPFYDLICADAYVWTVFRDESAFMDALFRLTQNSYDTRRGSYAEIGDCCVIKNCLTIKDVNVGSYAYIKGANKIKNVSIKSDEAESAQIGEGVELVNGIVGYGCHIFYGCKAVRFVMGNNSNLKYGARLIHSVLGDNSTVSCCEVLNNLVFPAHEQHHNNSFLIASMIMGQSNMAAGATVGSNHNSRGNDGEIIAGRGFWPGLSSTLKHNSRFACFTLITKGNYPNELNIPLPFSMLIENPQHNRLEVMPAYYWMYNMYALERNAWKYKNRDKRRHKEQFYVTDYLAPDTAQEIVAALALLEEWTGKAAYRQSGEKIPADRDLVRETGRRWLTEKPDAAQKLVVTGENMERSKRPVHLIKTVGAYAAYSQMLIFYGVKTIAACLEANALPFAAFAKNQTDGQNLDWLNLGGQLVPERKVREFRLAVTQGAFKNWQEVHGEYKRWWGEYEADNALCALQVLRRLRGSVIDTNLWNTLLDEAKQIRLYVEDQVYKTKLKDYTNSFRSCTYRNAAERDAVLGRVEDNTFIQASRDETASFLALLERVRQII